MDPFAKTMWRFGLTFAFGMLLAFIGVSVVYFHARPRCSDNVVSSATNSARQWTATIMERRCGEEAPFFTHVNLTPAGQAVRRGYFSGTAVEGEVFRAEQDALSAGVVLEWTAPERLTIRCARCDRSSVRQQEARWGPVEITYELSGR
jgi:ribosomal protein L37E